MARSSHSRSSHSRSSHSRSHHPPSTGIPILDRLRASGVTLLVERNGKLVFASDRRSVRPLYRAVIDHQPLFEGSDVADKVVGLAAAYLLLYARAGRVYALVMSQEAKRVLKENSIPHEAQSYVKAIDDEEGAHIPFEALAREHESASAFVESLRARLEP